MTIPNSLGARLGAERLEGDLSSLNFNAQLEELKVLKDGWLDGRGLAPPSEGLDWLAKAFNEHYSDSLSPPYLYPVAEGSVRFEWSLGPQDVSLEIDLKQKLGEWHSLNLESDEEEARTLRLETKDDWNWLVERLRNLSGLES